MALCAYWAAVLVRVSRLGWFGGFCWGLAYMTAQVTNAVVEGSLDVRQAGHGSVVGDATLYWLE